MNERSAVATERALRDAEEVTREATWLFGLAGAVAPQALAVFPSRTLPVVLSAMRRLDVRPTGPAVSLLSPRRDGHIEVTAAYPTAEPLTVGPPFVCARLPGGPAVQVLHPGPRRTVLSAYDRLNEWLAAHHVRDVPLMWEEYLDDDRIRIVVPLGSFGPDAEARAA